MNSSTYSEKKKCKQHKIMTQQEAKSKFISCFERLSYSQDYATTFSSFLDFALWRLAPYCAEQMKDNLNRLNKMYKEDLSPVICEMFNCWSEASDNAGEGFYDVLGDLFMDCVSHGKNGQFFTPQPVCDMMAQMTYGNDLAEGKSICDPACGSGRMLLSVGKLQRKLRFYGADNDHTCVKMAVLNLLVNTMEGEIAWMNSLSMEHYKSYHIKPILMGTHYVPFLTIGNKDDTSFVRKKVAENRLGTEMKQEVVQKIAEVKSDVQKSLRKEKKELQLALF
jgi:predicted RNA methylase